MASSHVIPEEPRTTRLKKGEEPKYEIKPVPLEEVDAPANFYHKLVLEFWYTRDENQFPVPSARIHVPSKGQMALTSGMRKAIKDDLRLTGNVVVVVRGPRTYLRRVEEVLHESEGATAGA